MRGNRVAVGFVLSLLAVACAAPTEERPEEPPRRLLVADRQVACESAPTGKCLLVKFQGPDAGDWRPFRGVIQGFDFRPGREYELLVRVERTEESALERWRLIEVVSERDTADEFPGSMAETLASRTWVLSLFGETGESPPGPTQISLQMDAEGKFTGSGGCNRYHGTYELDDEGKFSLGPIAATRMSCPDPVMKAETLYFRTLERARRQVLTGNRLLVLDESGTPILEYDGDTGDPR